ncbi:MAG: response regulator [Desulfobacterales bacterium]|nr:response regulator [Desulfobacterales bacterium]
MKNQDSILIIDDSNETLTILAELLKKEGFTVFAADSSELALVWLEKRIPDIILLDIMMSGIDGFELFRQIKLKDNLSQIPVIFLTGAIEVSRRVQGLKMGAVDYILKPFEKEELLARIRTHLEIYKLKKTLFDEREQLMVTLRSIGDGVITTDVQCRVVLINRVAEELTGWFQHEAYGKEIREVFHIIHEQTRLLCENPIEKVIQSGTIIELANNTLLVSRDGTERIIADSGSPIRDKDGNIIGVVLIFRDITHRVLIEKELQQAQRLESIGILAGGIAHDFNNMLGVISGNTSFALSQINQNDNLFQILRDVETATKQAQKLTHQLLTFAKGGAPIKKDADIRDVLKESANFMSRGTKVRCEFNFPENLLTVAIDAGQMYQAISNIVINASQAMPEGGIIEIQAENINIDSDDSFILQIGDYVKISIKDNGIGISEKHLSKIFDPYFTTKEKGRGLGLATTYSIIKAHTGHISVDSKVEHGTTFYIYLPATKTQLLSDKTTTLVQHKGQGRIIVMDDDQMILDMTGRLLQFLGYETSFAKDGKQAIEMYRQAFLSQQPFDLVILDLTIPGGMGGAKTILELLKIDSKVKAIVCSGYSNDPIMANYKDYGFYGVLAKPFTKEELEETLNSLINNKKENLNGTSSS